MALLETIIGIIALVVYYWDEIVNWLIRLCDAVKNIAHAAELFAQKVKGELVKLKYILYYKEEGNWVEETTTREIPEKEVPERLRKTFSKREKNISNDIEQELGLTL